MSERVLEWGSSEWGSDREVHPAAAAACGGEDLRLGHHPLGPVDVAEAALRRHQAARELRGLPAWCFFFFFAGRAGIRDFRFPEDRAVAGHWGRTVSSHTFSTQHFKSRVSNPRAIAYFHFRMLFESSNLPGAGPIFPRHSLLKNGRMGGNSGCRTACRNRTSMCIKGSLGINSKPEINSKIVNA